MNRFVGITKPLMWFTALLLAVSAAGCGSGGGGQGAILGAPVAPISVAPAGAIVPGAVCTAATGPTIPTVTVSDPTDGNQSATTSTSGVANAGKLITATFSIAMNPATINSTTFTLAPSGGSVLTPASVTYNTTTHVATLTTTSALLANTAYLAIITQGATSAAGTPIACSYAWNFKTAAAATTGAAPVNLGTATSFAIAAAAGVTNTSTTPLSHINGDAVLDPTTTCNGVTIDAAGGFGTCGGSAPTITGTVISPLFNTGVTSTAIKNDLLAAYNSITPANLPGATVLGCGTIGTGGGAGAGIGCAGNATLPPGVYISSTNSTIGVTGVLTLDGQGDTNATFIFQAPSALTTAAGAPGLPGSEIVLINGAKASNVFWQVGSSATIGTYALFQGNILADTTITMGTSSTSCGRLLAGAVTTSGAFVFDTNVVSVPGNGCPL
ncbi:ice-binding family protein [Sulfuriferula thiophila]|uniref:ice-binding family protein n=1 Tax=Sulfuriferula thiophila TaxID=1781211 RepID=UPI000F612AE9|nr:ice-binding family protein [Sulfuriferula thiophila]